MNSKVVVGLVVLLVGVAAGWYFLQGGKGVPYAPPTSEERVGEATPTEAPAVVTLSAEPPATGTTGAAEKGAVTGNVSVSYGTGGFAPNSVTVKKGTTVVWTNQSQSGMRVASAVHPTHQLLPGFDQLKSVGIGGTYEYTFEKVGTWKYHNHVQAADTGTVVVTE